MVHVKLLSYINICYLILRYFHTVTINQLKIHSFIHTLLQIIKPTNPEEDASSLMLKMLLLEKNDLMQIIQAEESFVNNSE